MDPVLLLCGSRNRIGREHEGLIRVLTCVCDTLPDSYGLVYWSDEESDFFGEVGGFRVLVLRHGQILDRLDPFLSPHRPVIEPVDD